jgi:hypothetical protein
VLSCTAELPWVAKYRSRIARRMQAHHPGMGPGVMQTNDADDFIPRDFYPAMSRPPMTAHTHAVPSMPGWSGTRPATEARAPGWFSPPQNDASMAQARSMTHVVSAPSLGMLQQGGAQSPAQASPAMFPQSQGPMHSHSMSASWAPPNGAQSPQPNGSAGTKWEEQIKEIMNQSNAAMSMSNPMNFHTMSGDMSMDSNANNMEGPPVDSMPTQYPGARAGSMDQVCPSWQHLTTQRTAHTPLGTNAYLLTEAKRIPSVARRSCMNSILCAHCVRILAAVQ